MMKKGQSLYINQLGRAGGMLPREILKLRSSEIAGSSVALVSFASSESSSRATKLHEKRHFA